jgi:hypothetical protein
MTETLIYIVAENMAEAIREWNRAKLERESWKPVVGQVPPVGILGSAKKANVMLTQALEEYEAFQHSMQRMRCTCRRNFEGAIIKIDPNCPLVQVVHR